MDSFVKSLVYNSKRYFYIALSIFVVFSLGLVQWKNDFSTPGWFSKDSPRVHKLKDYVRKFGNQSTNYAVVGVTFPESEIDLGHIELLSEKISKLKYVESVESITRYKTTYYENGEIKTKKLLDRYPEQSDFLRNIENHPIPINHLISKDKTFYIIHANVNDEVDYKNLSTEFITTLEKEVNKYKKINADYMILGSLSVTHNFGEYSKIDNQTVLPVMILLTVLILFFRYRNFSLVLSSLVIIGMSSTSAFGILFYLGRTYNNVIAIIPGLILATAIAQTVHVFLAFNENFDESNSKEKALISSLSKNLIPTFLTSLTTIVGFLAISFTELMPLSSLGIGCAIGTALTWLNTYFIAPHLILKFQMFSVKIKDVSGQERNLLTGLVALIDRYKVSIFASISIISALCLFYSTKVVVDSDLLNYFPKDSKISKDYYHGKRKMEDAFRRYPLVIDSGVADGALNADFLRKVDQFIGYLFQQSEVKKVFSVLDNIKEMNQAKHGGDPRFYVLPNSTAEIKNLITDYKNRIYPSRTIDYRLSNDQRFIKLRIYTSLEGTKEFTEKTNIYMNFARSSLSLTIEEGGFFAIYNKLNDLVADTFSKSSKFVFFVIFLIMLISFRSLFYAVISMIPNILPVSIMLAFMYWQGIYINIGTSIVTAICLGVAVDDTIHFMYQYIKWRRSGNDAFTSLKQTYKSAGNAVLFTTFILVVSFGCFSFASFVPSRQFGFLSALGLTIALACELILMPSILLLLDKKKYV